MKTSTRLLLAASLAGVLVAPTAANAGEKEAKSGKEIVHCYGVNKCKGTGDCGGKGHSCKGKNACKRKGYVDMPKEICLKIDGGRLTPEPKSDKS